jgi:hypothetical protein
MPPPKSKKLRVRADDPKQSTLEIFCGKVRDEQEKKRRVCEVISQVDDNKQTPDPSVEESTVEKRKFQSKWLHLYGSWIKYDNDKDQMYCSICRDPNLKKTPLHKWCI